MVKKTLSAKVSPKTLNRLEEYAEREGISKSEGTDRLLKQGLDVEESDMRLVPVKADGGTMIEDELEHTQQEIDKLQKQIGQHQTEAENVASSLQEFSVPFVLSILWLIVQNAAKIPSPFMEVSGVILAAWVSLESYRMFN